MQNIYLPLCSLAVFIIKHQFNLHLCVKITPFLLFPQLPSLLFALSVCLPSGARLP